jgi:hypothetical protein
MELSGEAWRDLREAHALLEESRVGGAPYPSDRHAACAGAVDAAR